MFRPNLPDHLTRPRYGGSNRKYDPGAARCCSWADRIARFGGRWTFILLFFGIILGWILLNVAVLRRPCFDLYPFILLNLLLSCLAALQAPVIMMSQNRQEEKDRERAKKDYMINLKAELELRVMHEKLDHLTQQQALALQHLAEALRALPAPP